MPKKSFPKLLGLVLLYNSPKLYCSPSIIIQENFHLSKHPNERFDRFFFLIKLGSLLKNLTHKKTSFCFFKHIFTDLAICEACL